MSCTAVALKGRDCIGIAERGIALAKRISTLPWRRVVEQSRAKAVIVRQGNGIERKSGVTA